MEETRVAWEKETERSLAVFQGLEEERYVLDLILQHMLHTSIITLKENEKNGKLEIAKKG